MRRTLGLAVAAIVLLVGGHFLLWRWAEQQLDAGFAAWAAANRAQGWTITSSAAQEAGWPLAARISVTDLFIAGGKADIDGGLTWSTDRLTLTVSLLHPRVLNIASDGMQRLRIGDLPEVGYTADRLDGRLPLDPGVPPRSVALQAVNLRAGLPSAAEATGATVAALDLHADWTPAAQQGEPVAAVTLAAQGIGLPPGRPWPFGPRVASLSVDASLGGPLPRLGGLAIRAAAWRDGGGTMEVHRLAIDWGRLDASGTATLALDEAMQPMGAGSVHIVEPAGMLDALAANGAIGDRAAFAAKTLLALMTHTPADGAPAVELPWTLQNQRLAMGRFPLAKLPQLSWPAAP